MAAPHQLCARLCPGAGTKTSVPAVLPLRGLPLEQVYDGRHFPDFYYKNSMASVLLSLNNQMNEQETLYFPCAESEITRTLCRLGATQPEKFTATLIATDDDISPAVRSVFEGEYPLTEHLKTLNALSKCLQLFDAQTLDKFHTVFDTIWPDTPEEILWIAENKGLPHRPGIRRLGRGL